MTRDEIRTQIVGVLQRLAPEVDPQSLKGDAPLRDQIDLDSMDMLNLVIGLSERLGIEVPEADYGRLATLDGAVSYLGQATESARVPGCQSAKDRGTMDRAST